MLVEILPRLHLLPENSKQSEINTNHISIPPEDHTHCLLTSHHLIAPSKRRDLFSLSHSYNLFGFHRTGSPGLIYASGAGSDIAAFVQEVKSWQWKALRVRIVENVEKSDGEKAGSWTEVEKVADVLRMMKDLKRMELVTAFGIGVA